MWKHKCNYSKAYLLSNAEKKVGQILQICQKFTQINRFPPLKYQAKNVRKTSNTMQLKTKKQKFI